MISSLFVRPRAVAEQHKTHGQGGTRLDPQSDGNLVLYTSYNSPLWTSGTDGSGATALTLENNGVLTLYHDSTVIWSRA
jgi:hypothetical protein